MANSQLLALACLAVLAASAVAAPAAGCTTSSQNQAGTLTEQKPKGCLASKKVQDALQGLIEPACFNSVKMNVTNSTGADCEIPGTYFNVSFADATKCLDGMDVGGGSMTPVAGGGSSVKGEFITGQTLTGSSTPAGLFTVTVAGMDCSLVYSTKNVGTPNVTTTGTTATATKAADAAPAPAAATAAAANTTAAKSSAAAAAPAALMALVAGALALAF